MLPKAKRLKRTDFEVLLSNSNIKIVYNALGTLKYLPSSSKKISVVTSGKHEKSAVKRNKIRRRIYSLFSKQDINIFGVMYVSKNSFNFDFETIKKYFNELIFKTKKNT